MFASPTPSRQFAKRILIHVAHSLPPPVPDHQHRRSGCRTDCSAWYRRNFGFFGAPVGLIFCIDRQLGLPQWSDIGSYVQTVMYLARGHGLVTRAQVAWSRVYGTVAEFLDLPEGQMVYCGMAMGYADPDAPGNNFRMPRAPVEEYCRFHGFE